MKRKWELTFGVGVNHRGEKIGSEASRLAELAILHRACDVFGGATITRTQGAWNNAEGKTVIEDSRVLTIITERPSHDVLTFAGFIGTVLQQESVLIVETDLRAVSFYETGIAEIDLHRMETEGSGEHPDVVQSRETLRHHGHRPGTGGRY